MLRPNQILSFGAAFCLLAGCASRGTATVSSAPPEPPAQAQEAAQANTPARHHALPAAPAAAAPIQAGESTPEPSGFTQANGQLKPTLQAYAAEVARTRNIPQPQVEHLLKDARYDAEVARLMSPAKTRVRRSWSTYRQRFVEPVRLKAGLAFWREHAQTLEAVEQDYGVPASVIVAIIGVETIFGRYTGDFRALDALATLGFRYPDGSRPERSQLFRDQLADLAQLHHEKRIDAYTIKGSYAGAIGLPQFMPGSLRRYAVDGDNDGRIDLLHTPADAIASVANFLRHHGWVPELPIFAPVALTAEAKKLVTGAIDPGLSWKTLKAHGATTSAQAGTTAWQAHPLGVVDLVEESRNTAEYRVGTPNFFAITHYNRSYFYATAVAELAAELEQRMNNTSVRAPRREAHGVGTKAVTAFAH